MSETETQERITSTAAARSAIADLRTTAGSTVMFVQSDDCSASSPVCCPDLESIVGGADVLIGHVEGCPFYLDRHVDDARHENRFVLDVEAGDPDGFSLGAGAGRHFVTRPTL